MTNKFTLSILTVLFLAGTAWAHDPECTVSDELVFNDAGTGFTAPASMTENLVDACLTNPGEDGHCVPTNFEQVSPGMPSYLEAIIQGALSMPGGWLNFLTFGVFTDDDFVPPSDFVGSLYCKFVPNETTEDESHTDPLSGDPGYFTGDEEDIWDDLDSDTSIDTEFVGDSNDE